jgi:SSS family solute:Na+ symporter
MDVAIVGTYFLALIFVGSRSFRAIKGVNSFFVVDRRASLLLVAGSLFGTIIGGSSTIGMAGLGYQKGLVGSWWLLVGALGLFFLAIFLAERVRGYALYTLPEILEVQYGSEVKFFASALIVIAWVGIVAGQIVAAGRILETLLPIQPNFLMTTTALVFIAYTLLGGQHSVIRTDSIQSLIIVVAILISLPLCLNKAGIGSMRGTLGAEYFSFPVSAHFSWKSLATYFFLVGSTYLVGPDMFSRLFCARNKKTAKGAAMTVALALIPYTFIITLIGMSARVLFPHISPEAAFPTMINHLFPPGLNGVVIAALLAALMSSADTCLLTTSTILSIDIIKPLICPDATEHRLLLLTRLFIIVLGVVSLLVALKLRGVISSLLLGYSVYTSGLAFPILAGFWREKLGVGKGAVISAMLVGGGFAFIGKLIEFGDAGLYGFFLSGIILIAGSTLGSFIRLRRRPRPMAVDE